MRLADALEAAADERVADESLVMTAAMILVARRIARLSPDHTTACNLASISGRQLGALIAIEFQKKQMGV
jgi:hypothetical protein